MMFHSNSKLVIASIVGTFFVLFIVVEAIIARYKHYSLYSYKYSFANFKILILRHILNSVLSASLVLYILNLSYAYSIHAVDSLNKYVYWISLIIAQDFFYYWFHRYSHVCRFGWASHVVHHSSTYFNYTTAVRESVTYVLSGIWVFWLPLTFLGYTPTDVIIAVVINLVYQFFLHTQLIKKLGIIELVFNTPSHHRVHHGRNPKYINKNYAGILIIWDKMFGTFVEEKQTPEYGITTPLNSFNPIVILFHEWYHMFRDVFKARSLKYLVSFSKVSKKK